MNLRDAIKAKCDLKESTIRIDEWETDLLVRELSIGERGKIMDLHISEDATNEDKVIATVIAGTYNFETGEKLFTAEDADWMVNKSSDALDKLYKAILKLSGVDVDAQGGEKSEAGKPSDTTQGSTTTTD